MEELEIYSTINKKKVTVINGKKGQAHIHGEIDVDVIARYLLGMKQNIKG